jgi:hypothetical protein
VSDARPVRTGLARRLALLAAVAVLGLGGGALGGCGDDDEETAATTPTTTETEADVPTPPPDESGEGDGGGSDQTPADTGTTVPESGGVGADDVDPEQHAGEDTEQNDLPPPPGSPAEQFEQECEANPEIC